MPGSTDHQRITLPMVQQEEIVSEPPEEFAELLEWISAGVDWLEQIEDDEVRRQIFEILDGIDALHRHALLHFVQQVQILGGPGLIERIAVDEVVQLLLDLYDIEPGRRSS